MNVATIINGTLMVLQARKVGDSSEAEETDSIDADGNPNPASKSLKKSEGQWVEAIEKENMCDTHDGKACLIDASGNHHNLTIGDKSLWGMLLVR
jgi:hypothetical protein